MYILVVHQLLCSVQMTTLNSKSTTDVAIDEIIESEITEREFKMEIEEDSLLMIVKFS